MRVFSIVAHRGATRKSPENTLPALRAAADMGADAVEIDVRLTRDGVPVVFHYYYLEENTSLQGPIFELTAAQLRRARVIGPGDETRDDWRIPTLQEALTAPGGRIGFEIEIKGPEEFSPQAIAEVLQAVPELWPRIEVTSYEPGHLLDFTKLIPDIPVDLLIPRTEPWMHLDVVAYEAVHRGRLAGARAVHLHPSQLSNAVVTAVRNAGLEVHAWDVNDQTSFETIVRHGVHTICTDRLEEALEFRSGDGGERT